MRRFIYLAIALLWITFPLHAKEPGRPADPDKIHQKAFTIDTHTDTPLRFIRTDFDMGKRNDAVQTGSKVDFPRMKEGGLDALFFAVFLNQGDRDSATINKVRKEAATIFNEIYKTVHRNEALAELAYSPKDAYRIQKEGKRVVFIGMENGYPIGKDLDYVQEYYDLGARYITLCHGRNNDICDSSTDPAGPEHHGLSEFGIDVVKEMNRLGMLIDVSHISDESFYDVIEISRAPIIASHSCTRTLCNSPRNLDDDMLRALAMNGGVIQICFVSSYLKEFAPEPKRDSAMSALRNKYRDFPDLGDKERAQMRKEWQALNAQYPPRLATVSDVVDHIDHVVKVAGIDHVGIGTDFDGGGEVQDCFDVSQMGNITRELVKRGYTAKEIEKIWGGNFMRVFREVVKLADK